MIYCQLDLFGTNFKGIQSQTEILFIRENTFESVVCKISAIIFLHQYTVSFLFAFEVYNMKLCELL